jgi:hypothetical protein
MLRHYTNSIKNTLYDWGGAFKDNFLNNLLHSLLLLFIINYMDFFAEQSVAEHTCPPNNLSQDTAKIASFVIFGFRFIGLPALLKLYISNNDDEMYQRRKKAFIRTEREFYLSASELIFLFYSAKKYAIYNIGTQIIAVLISTWPAFCAICKLWKPGFVRGTFADYYEKLPDWSAGIGSGIEVIHKFFTLPANVDNFIGMMIDVFYMTTHDDRPSAEKPITLSLMVTSGIINMFTPKTTAAWNVSQSIQFFLKFYIILGCQFYL